jgi:hypothetical protein
MLAGHTASATADVPIDLVFSSGKEKNTRSLGKNILDEIKQLNYYRLKAGRLKTSGGLNRRLKDEAPERRWFLPPSAPGGLKEFTDNKPAKTGLFLLD